jgi:hypothetical protein
MTCRPPLWADVQAAAFKHSLQRSATLEAVFKEDRVGLFTLHVRNGAYHPQDAQEYQHECGLALTHTV